MVIRKIQSILSLCVLVACFLFTFASPATADGFGSWESRDSNKSYFAETDGFVVSYSYVAEGQTAFVSARTPDNYVRIVQRFTAPGQDMVSESLTLPVRAGDTWEIKAYDTATTVVQWIPIERY
ncbi:MAG: hypothetical protein F6K30_26705 [Cyanothece sp. SIO2G6]|nr:hypothetical protein [Cyanothece sp. SIO2G6]